MTRQRLLLLTAYYAGWSIAGAIVGVVALIAAVNAADGTIPVEWALVAGIPGAGAGAGLAHAARRTRWPQIVLMIAGTAATAVFAYHAAGEFFGPRGFLWQLVFIIALALSGCGAAAALGGAAGLVLIRRRLWSGVRTIV
jgi:hypothetical protein